MFQLVSEETDDENNTLGALVSLRRAKASVLCGWKPTFSMMPLLARNRSMSL